MVDEQETRAQKSSFRMVETDPYPEMVHCDHTPTPTRPHCFSRSSTADVGPQQRVRQDEDVERLQYRSYILTDIGNDAPLIDV